MNSKIIEIEQAMQAHLDNYQMEQLHRVLFHVFDDTEKAVKDESGDILPFYLAPTSKYLTALFITRIRTDTHCAVMPLTKF